MKDNLFTDMTVNEKQLYVWFEHIQQQAAVNNHRIALVLSGEKKWCYLIASQLVKANKFKSVLTVSENMPMGLSPGKARTQLGREYNAIVFDAYQEFDIDAFGAVTGTLCGGGMLILILPEETDWSELKTSRFLQRALPVIKNHQGVYFVRENENLPEIKFTDSTEINDFEIEWPYRTPEQKQVVNAIKASVVKQSKSPVVLISDRGRGKSSALGLAAGALIELGIKKIIVSAPRLSVGEPVFRHAEQILSGAVVSHGKLGWQDAELKFVAPDALLLDQPEAELLLIDEAAAIPLAMLEKLLHIYPQIVFSTTIHGYEGTGRGFALKFNKVLDQYAPNWQQFNMTTPVRWAVNDPLEAWIDKLLCLDSEMSVAPSMDALDIRQCKVCLIDRDELIHDDRKLSSLFSLLIYAHYRTRPSDLRHLLDDEKVYVYTLESAANILAVALVNREGGFDAQLSTEIYRGLRRPQGHLLPQTLTFHAGCEQAGTLNYARIMRIAVHPELQGQGLGTYLLKNIIEQEEAHVDAIGTSFGATVELLSFWDKAGFEMVRMGFTQDHASGTHSAVMMMPFGEIGCQVFSQIRKKFQHHLSYWLAEPLRYLPGDIRSYLERQAVEDVSDLSDEDWKDIHSFIDTHRGYETCMGPINKLLKKYSLISKINNHQDKLILETKVLQQKSWSETVKICGLTGKAKAIQKLRQAVFAIIEQYNLR